jgi:hypothetical protein
MTPCTLPISSVSTDIPPLYQVRISLGRREAAPETSIFTKRNDLRLLIVAAGLMEHRGMADASRSADIKIKGELS